MRRSVAVVVLGVAALVVGLSALGASHRPRGVRAREARPRQRQIAAERARAKLQIFRNMAPSTPPQTAHVPQITIPSIQGHACPVASSGPCPTTPCTIYVQPGVVPGPVLQGRAILPPGTTARTCSHKQIQAIPAMAR
jgi:hypothetical protein